MKLSNRLRRFVAVREYQVHWNEFAVRDDYTPAVLMVSGLMAAQFMYRQWFQRLSKHRIDIALMPNHLPEHDLLSMVMALPINKPLIVIGYSQGAFECMKLVHALKQAQPERQVELLVTVAGGGMGRLYPTQWFKVKRKVPSNVKKVLNVFAQNDRLGTDWPLMLNRLQKAHDHQITDIQNICVPSTLPVTHLDMVRTHPTHRVSDFLEHHVFSVVDHFIESL